MELQRQVSAMTKVPTTLWVEIFRTVSDISDLSRVCRVCKYFEKVVTNPKHACFAAHTSLQIIFLDADSRPFGLSLQPSRSNPKVENEKETHLYVGSFDDTDVALASNRARLYKVLPRFTNRRKCPLQVDAPWCDPSWLNDEQYWNVLSNARHLILRGDDPIVPENFLWNKRCFTAESLEAPAQALFELGVDSFPRLKRLDLEIFEDPSIDADPDFNFLNCWHAVIASLGHVITSIYSDPGFLEKVNLHTLPRLESLRLIVGDNRVVNLPAVKCLELDLDSGTDLRIGGISRLHGSLESLTVSNANIYSEGDVLLTLARAFSNCTKWKTWHISTFLTIERQMMRESMNFEQFKEALVEWIFSAMFGDSNGTDWMVLPDTVQHICLAVDVNRGHWVGTESNADLGMPEFSPRSQQLRSEQTTLESQLFPHEESQQHIQNRFVEKLMGMEYFENRNVEVVFNLNAIRGGR